jgi:hypothetical protein
MTGATTEGSRTLTRSDLLSAHKQRLEETDLAEQHLDLRAKLRRRNGAS